MRDDRDRDHLLAMAAMAAERSLEVTRVRASRAPIRQIIDKGYHTSATFRRLLTALEVSDTILYIEPGIGRTRATFQFLVSAGGVRYVRIFIAQQTDRTAIIALIAHELQHAVEVANAPEVVNDLTLEALYRRIGRAAFCGLETCYETEAAVRAARDVLEEMRRPTRSQVTTSEAGSNPPPAGST